MLAELWVADQLAAGALTGNVAPVWSMVEYPLNALDRETWRALFEEAGYTVDGGDGGVAVERPDGPLRLYRGAPLEHRDGWSWTDDRAVAERFASGGLRGRLPGAVWTAEVEPWRLLAAIPGGRGEAEYVADTEGLRIVAAEP